MVVTSSDDVVGSMLCRGEHTKCMVFFVLHFEIQKCTISRDNWSADF